MIYGISNRAIFDGLEWPLRSFFLLHTIINAIYSVVVQHMIITIADGNGSFRELLSTVIQLRSNWKIFWHGASCV